MQHGIEPEPWALKWTLCYLEMYWRDHCSLGYQAFAFCIRHHIGNPRTKVAWGFRDTRLEISCSAALVDYFPNMVLSSWKSLITGAVLTPELTAWWVPR